MHRNYPATGAIDRARGADARALASCYELTWGRHRVMTLASPGNHDYVRGHVGDFSEYFGVDAPHDGGFIAFTGALTDGWRLVALDSNYERFDPLDAEGQPLPDGQAPRQFVVGTGGARLYGFWKPPYRSQARVLEHGVLQLSLERGRYSWRFIDVAGRVRDAGAARCRWTVN